MGNAKSFVEMQAVSFSAPPKKLRGERVLMVVNCLLRAGLWYMPFQPLVVMMTHMTPPKQSSGEGRRVREAENR